MAASVLYTNFGGATVHEHRHSEGMGREGEERFYVADTLGSTAVLTDQAGAVTDTMEFWPYGETAARTGTTKTPFTWVGTFGYYRDSAKLFYVRMRSYVAGTGSWTRVDPLWPTEKAYHYVSGHPVLTTDAFGLSVVVDLLKDCGWALGGALAGHFFGNEPVKGNPGELMCKSSSACAIAILSALLFAVLGANPLAGCISGAASAIAGNLIGRACEKGFGDPRPPCKKEPDCLLKEIIGDALVGCAVGLVGGGIVQLGSQTQTSTGTAQFVQNLRSLLVGLLPADMC